MSAAGSRTAAAVRAADERTGQVPLARRLLRYVFPEHWSFMWGEIALYCFVVLLVTGVYLAFFFDPSYRQVVYHGPYTPLDGQRMSAAYASTLELSWQVRAGLLMRQTHHWAADLFIASITVHMLRVFFTGAYRKPRELTYWIGLTLLLLGVLEGYMGYSLVDDLLSGMGLAIGWSVAMSIPIVGGPLATWLWDGPFPGTSAFESRLFIAHVFIVPVVLGALIGLHLAFVAMLHHTQFEGRGTREANVVGAPMWPSYALRSLGLFCVVFGGLIALGGLVQINPVWLWGPYHPYLGANGAQPDWYLGWLIGALRLMPNWEPTIGGHTVVPNPFWGGVLFPLVVFGLLYAWPLAERRLTADRDAHHLLQRPRDAAGRTAFGVGLFTFAAVPFFAGSMDRIYLQFGLPYQGAVRVTQVLWIALPVLAAAVTWRVCRNLSRSESHPLRGASARMVGRMDDGGLVAGRSLLANPSWTPPAVPPASPPAGTLHGLRRRVRLSALGAGAIGTGGALALAAGAAGAVAVGAALALAVPGWLAALITALLLVVITGCLVLTFSRRR